MRDKREMGVVVGTERKRGQYPRTVRQEIPLVQTRLAIERTIYLAKRETTPIWAMGCKVIRASK
jgi:hypothetical protein